MSNSHSAAGAARVPDGGHQGTGLERPAYSQAPRRGGETGVCVPNKYNQSRKRLFHGRDLTTAGISIRVVVWGRRKMSKLENPALKRGVNGLQHPVRPRRLGRSRDSGGLTVDLQYVMGYFFGSKQLNLSFSL
ncbi:MAG: hypothetical protein DMG05_19635 [Acidobacteria bacterium]|nr:MAG: hypothetical protein DMG05_19635 [Acidobacteriota bacterium]